MNALKIKKSGWLWKLARNGGMPSDGLVPDKANSKFNRLLKAKYDADEIEYDEMKDRKSTLLNSSHYNISYAVFCLKKSWSTYSASHSNLWYASGHGRHWLRCAT